MHEAGIARVVADEIRDRALPGDHVRLLVTGGHGDPDDFDAALRFHLEVVLSGYDTGTIEIVHRPTQRMCSSCAVPFEGVRALDPCPTCGSPGMAVPGPEQIDLEFLGQPAGAGA